MSDKGFEPLDENLQEPAQETIEPVNPAEEDSLVDDIIFGSATDEAFATPQETKPVEPVVKPAGQPDSNEELQYQYWQSQADKARNENQQMSVELEKLKQQQANPTPVEPTKPVAPAEEEIEKFPEPPAKPGEPQGFNMEEAYSDPYSASAKFLKEKEQWHDDMYQYNNLKTDYVAAVNQQYIDTMNQQQAKQREAYEMQARQKSVLDNVKQTVVSKYGADSSTVDNFIQEMSKPEALSIDNLWKLYNLNNSKQGVPSPSPEFRQTQQTQHVPSPMGVMPSAETRANSRSAADIVMDDIIEDYKGKQPF